MTRRNNSKLRCNLRSIKHTANWIPHHQPADERRLAAGLTTAVDKEVVSAGARARAAARSSGTGTAQAMIMLLFCVVVETYIGVSTEICGVSGTSTSVSSQPWIGRASYSRPTSEFHGNATPSTTPQGVDVGQGPLNLSVGSLEGRLSATSVVNSLIFSFTMEIRTYPRAGILVCWMRSCFHLRVEPLQCPSSAPCSPVSEKPFDQCCRLDCLVVDFSSATRLARLRSSQHTPNVPITYTLLGLLNHQQQRLILFNFQTIVIKQFVLSHVCVCVPLSFYLLSRRRCAQLQAAPRSRTPLLRQEVRTCAAMPLDRKQREAWSSESADPLLSEMVEV